MDWARIRPILRRLARRRAFVVSVVALIGSALGMLVTTGSVAHATRSSSMPYADPDRLVALYWSSEELGIPDMSLSLVVARELIERTSAFEAVAATLTPIHVALRTQEGPVHLSAGLAMPEAFELLGIRPAEGRAFTAEEGENGTGGTAVILAHEAAERLFGAAREALGATLVINELPREVVGVLPPRRSLAPEQAQMIDVWLPMGVAAEFLGDGTFTSPTARSFRANARLREGVTSEGLAAELSRLGDEIARDYPDTDEGSWQLHADPLRDRVVAGADTPIVTMFLGSVLFCGIAILNLAGLLYVRADGDAHDMAIRRALGATQTRVERLRATDAIVLGTLAAALACVLVYGGFAILGRSRLVPLPEYVTLALDWPRVAVIFALSLGAALIFGALAGRASDRGAAAPGTVASRGVRHPRRTRAMLFMLGAQVALSTALTVAALAAFRSLDRLRAMDVGIEPEALLSARMDVPRGALPLPEVARRGRDLVQNIRDLPGVQRAFVWSPELPTDAHTFTGLRLESAADGGERASVIARYHTISAGSAVALGLRLVAGRDMTDDDWDSGRRVALVSASAAERWWGSADAAIGQRIRRTSHTEWSDVIGVLADAPLSGRFGPGSDNALDVFFMFDQDPRSTFLLFVRGDRSEPDVGALRDASANAFPATPLYDVRWMSDRLRDQERTHRSTSALGTLFAVASLILASIGLAGSSMLVLDRRKAEVGIRRALGATGPRTIVELLRSSLLAVVAGIVAGVLLARAGLRFVDPVILRVGPDDPLSQLGAALILGGVAVVALLTPSLSICLRDPAQNLKTTTRAL